MVQNALSRFVVVALAGGWGLAAVAQQQEGTPVQVEIEQGDVGAPLELGVPPPPPEWGPWRRGEPVVLGGEKGPACTVFAFYPYPREVSGPIADGDADYLAELQRRYADRGARFVVAMGDPELKLGDAWSACSVVVDTDRRVATAWCAIASPGLHVVVCDRAGNTVFQGEPGTGIVDAITGALDGTFDLRKTRERMALRDVLLQDFDSIGRNVKPGELVEHAGHDGLLWGAAYLVAAHKGDGADATKAIHKQAIECLANEWRPLAVFADLALRADGRAPDLAADLAAALQPVSASAAQDPFVQLAYLRALVLADRGREVGRQAARASKLARTSALHSVAFAEILTHAATPAVHGDLVRQATRRAEELGSPPRLLAALQYATALRCDEDPAAAKAILNAYLGEVEVRTQINNDCWYLMTELPTMGRFPWFAAGLAERMLEQRANMDYFEFDTVALAMFQVGRFAEAVELQETAIKRGGEGNPEYTSRLQRYKAKVAPAPR